MADDTPDSRRGYRQRQMSAWHQANRDHVLQRQRQRYAAMGRFARRYLRHGINAAKWSRLWDAQAGLCFLCDRELDPDRAIIEHWHGCTAGHPRDKSCDICRRGLACRQCNTLIGQVDDDTTLLRMIADRLDAAQANVMARQEQAPVQLSLLT